MKSITYQPDLFQVNGNYDKAWKRVAYNIASKTLKSLEIRCPKCKRNGTVLSRWKKGVSVKPLYVVHPPHNNKRFKLCLLNKSAARVARTKIRMSSNDIIKLMRIGKPFVLFSGGRDSLCLLEYMRKLSGRINVDITALHANTTAGFPEVEDYILKVCKSLKIPLIVVKPPYDYFDVAKRWGIPGVKSRWCCHALKIAPIKRYLAQIEGPKVVFDGIRGVESYLRSTYVPVWFHPSFRSISVSPIFHWSNQKVDDYLLQSKLPENPTADLGTSGECWCGAYKTKTDFESLLEVHPDIFEKLIKVEEAQCGKFTFIYEKGQRIPLSSLRKKQ